MTHITENQWLEYYGFQRFPFDRPEAGNEEFSRPDFLASCFVEPSCFERVLGQPDATVSAIVYAARGTGKTACRTMMDYYCRIGQFPSRHAKLFDKLDYVLSVPHIHLHRVLEIARQKTAPGNLPTILVEIHVQEILERAVPILADLIASQQLLTNSVENLSADIKQDLGWLITYYRRYLSTTQMLFFYRLGLLLVAEGLEKIIGFRPRRGSLKSHQSLSEVYRLLQSRAEASPLDHLTQWASLIRHLGIKATYVLVDGVDELTETAGNPYDAFMITRPLLTSLRLMDGTPYFALKFFLPDTLEPFIRTDPAIRQDRGFIVEHIQWHKEHLIQILRYRLDALKVEPYKRDDRTETNFDTFCVPELRGQIESDLAHWAQGNPRYMMLLCGLIITVHCASEITDQDDPYQLNRQDVQIALEQFNIKMAQSQQAKHLEIELPLLELIAQGEHDRLEFKASLQWDLHKKAINKEMREIIARAIAGMLNRDGGTLLIGVADDGMVVGIENDLKAIRKHNEDGFKLEIGRIVETYIGLQYAHYLQVRFDHSQNKTVCVIQIRSSTEPVYFRSNNQDEFWVRLDNSTRKLDVKAAITYINAHWKKTA